jgi:hypothetical protein
MRLLFVF